MRARFINEQEVSKDEKLQNLKKIKEFAKENGYEFGTQDKTNTPYISVPVKYDMRVEIFPAFWSTLVRELRYTFTYPPGWDGQISLRKVWYGYKGETEYFGDEVYKFSEFKYVIKELQKEFNVNEAIKHLKGRSEEEIKQAMQKYINNLSRDEKIQLLNHTNLKQSLMGRFNTIEEALKRVKISIKKEQRKNES